MIPSIHSRALRALHRRPTAQRERGVVLIVVMVLLVAVTFMSISVMRSTLSSDLITNNNRTQTLAMEMAQLALRFCEADAASNKLVIQPKVAASTQMLWQKKDSWEGAGSALVAKELSEDNLKSANTPFVPAKRPQCVAEYDPNADGVVVMTARGFSPDYKSDSDKISAGSVVWLQSRFIFKSAGSGGGTPGGSGTGTGTGT
ncbi:hypothetical protein [Aquabacterium sp. NJ1]|uniref:pilus assembly PilX family protein n=1 Tax=Aquabacterium sp. NJ1 TaxID=1538295 RepID=UPI001269BCDF|nr:hypothetical protein [Aquabacterium sp. NJ1]